PDPPVDVDLGSRAVRKRDTLARDAHIVLQVLGDVVARLEIGGDRRLVIGLRDAAEDVVRGDAGAEGDVPRIRRRRRRCRGRDFHIGCPGRRRQRDGGTCRLGDPSRLLPLYYSHATPATLLPVRSATLCCRQVAPAAGGFQLKYA